MKQIEKEIIVNTSPGRVWQVLSDFENYRKWNPFILNISGDKYEGGSLTIQIKPPGGNEPPANPLTPDQVSLVRAWIDQGAK